MNYRAKVVADSVGPNGVRLTTMEFDIWKPLLAEFNTHGLLASRNFPSSRAIPWAKMRKKILENPHIPLFRKNNPGMQPAEPLSREEQLNAESVWLQARNDALNVVECLGHKDGLNIHKQWLNRLLEPWITVTGLVTATEWDNFFNLRLELNDKNYPMAQDEFYFMARAMKNALDESVPTVLEVGQVHAPYVERNAIQWLHDKFSDDLYNYIYHKCMLSAGKCATVSYDNLGEGVDHQKDYDRAVNQLLPFGHMSVFQHQAICLPERISMADYNAVKSLTVPATSYAESFEDNIETNEAFSGQLRGWTQFRKTLPNEAYWVSPNAGRELALDLPELYTE